MRKIFEFSIFVEAEDETEAREKLESMDLEQVMDSLELVDE